MKAGWDSLAPSTKVAAGRLNGDPQRAVHELTMSTLAFPGVRLGRYAAGAGSQVIKLLSPPDAGLFFCLLAESDHPELAAFTILAALSRSPDHPPMDVDPARRLLGFEPRDTYPEHLPEELRGPGPSQENPPCD